MSFDPVISLRQISKAYRTYAHPLHGLLARFTGDRVGRYKEFQALRDVSLDIKKGETVGIIGRNGSGKSTLLQLICGIRKPTSGHILVKGRISALLELGSGFHAELTGRENVYIQGAIFGFTRETMADRFNDITAFAEIGEFIDQPVKTYSSGMFLRLAFAVAVHVDPEILVVDEALSVGDAQFQLKCFNWLRQMRQKGVTIFLVSHDMNVITSLCSRAIILDGGFVFDQGDPKAMSASYHKLLFGNQVALLPSEVDSGGGVTDIERRGNYGQDQFSTASMSRYGSGEAHLTRWGILDNAGNSCRSIVSGTAFELFMKIRFDCDATDVSYGFAINDSRGTALWGMTNISQGTPPHMAIAGEEYLITAACNMWLSAGDYFLVLGAAHLKDGRKIDFVENAVEIKVIGPGGTFTNSVVNLQASMAIATSKPNLKIPTAS